MKNGKFEIGDIVCGNSEREYGITNNEMTQGKIINIDEDGFLDIVVLVHTFIPEEAGNVYPGLNPKYFDLVKSASEPDNLYHFTTDMATFVEVTHGENTAKSKCDTRFDKFDIHIGIDVAMDCLNKKEKQDAILKYPKYVRYIGEFHEGGLEKGDICKILSYCENNGWLYVTCPSPSIFEGKEATNPENLVGVNFTFLGPYEYEPVTVYG